MALITRFDDAATESLRVDLLDIEGEVPVPKGRVTKLAPDNWRTMLTKDLEKFEVFPDSRMSYLTLSLVNFPPARFADRRASFEVGDWRVTIHDRCEPDLFRSLKKATGFAFTAACRIERCDGREFTRAKAERVLSDLWHALSFARGAEVGMALEAGFNTGGQRIYARWESTLCE